MAHSACIPVKRLMGTSILGMTQRINMTSRDAGLGGPIDPGSTPAPLGGIPKGSEVLVPKDGIQVLLKRHLPQQA